MKGLSLSEFNAFPLFTAFGTNKNIFSGDCMSSWSLFFFFGNNSYMVLDISPVNYNLIFSYLKVTLNNIYAA